MARSSAPQRVSPVFTATFAVKAQAEAWARRLESQIDAGIIPDGRAVVGRALLLRDVIADYRKLRGSSRPVVFGSNEHYMLKKLEKHLGARDVFALSVDDLIGFAREREEDGAEPYTINMDIGKLGTVLRLVSGVRHMNLPGQWLAITSHVCIMHQK